MTPHEYFKQMTGPYFGSEGYKETHEGKVEQRIEAKWDSFIYFIKRLFKPRNKR